MCLTIFSCSERRYRRLRAGLVASASQRLLSAGLDAETVLTAVLRDGLSVERTGLRARPTGQGMRIFTPRQLTDVLRLLLVHDSEVASYLVMVVLPKTLPRRIDAHDFAPLVTFNLPSDFQGDVMMGLEKIRAVLPEQVEKGAQVVARSLCMMRSLRLAKETFQHLGVPYTEELLDERDVGKLLAEKFIPDGTIVDQGNGRKRLTVDSVIRELVGQKLKDLSVEAGELVLGKRS